MQPIEQLDPLPTNPDGTINAKEALTVITENNTKCLSDVVVLSKLQQWILDTRKNIQKEGK